VLESVLFIYVCMYVCVLDSCSAYCVLCAVCCVVFFSLSLFFFFVCALNRVGSTKGSIDFLKLVGYEETGSG
jgi:hypothetical protein